MKYRSPLRLLILQRANSGLVLKPRLTRITSDAFTDELVGALVTKDQRLFLGQD